MTAHIGAARNAASFDSSDVFLLATLRRRRLIPLLTRPARAANTCVPSTTAELLSLFDATGNNAADWQPSYSVAPTDPARIVREWFHDETVQRDVDLASWDLKPGWAKPGGPAPVNARLGIGGQ